MSAILDASGVPSTVTCVAWGCASIGDKSTGFCPAHWRNVPVHIRIVISDEASWCRRAGNKPDQTSALLMRVAIERELYCRVRSDPKEARRFEEQREKYEKMKSASDAGLVGPGGRPLVAPELPR